MLHKRMYRSDREIQKNYKFWIPLTDTFQSGDPVILWRRIIISIADDQGRFVQDRDKIAAIVSNKDKSMQPGWIEMLLNIFIEKNLLLAYEADSKKLLQIVTWWKWQRTINNAAMVRPSLLPAPDGWQDRFRFVDDNLQVIQLNWDSNK